MKMRDGHTVQMQADKLSEAMSNWLEKTDYTAIWRTCYSCSFLAPDDRTCTKYNAQPPVSTVVVGCDLYKDRQNSGGFSRTMDDDIPF